MEEITRTRIRTVCEIVLVNPNSYHQNSDTNMLKSPGTSRLASNTNKVNMNPFPKISLEQMTVLENEFLKLKTLHNTDLELLAAELGLDEKDVRDWYHERLAAWRRGQGLSDTFGQL